jgi:hypothetical protein
MSLKSLLFLALILSNKCRLIVGTFGSMTFSSFLVEVTLLARIKGFKIFFYVNMLCSAKVNEKVKWDDPITPIHLINAPNIYFFFLKKVINTTY